MQGLRIIWVGKTSEHFVAEGIEHYRKRIRAFAPLEMVELRAESHSGRDGGKAVAKEGEALLGRLAPGQPLVLLDERGQQLDTHGFAATLQRLRESAGQAPTFAIGGAYGVSDAVRDRAEHVLALSRLTFPHQMVRLVLLEQVYRALSLAAGHGYHHE